jgi:opacity protein-like surface antigen
MKKMICAVMMALAMTASVNAQTVIANNYDSPISSANGQSANNDFDPLGSQGGFEVKYHAIEKGWGVGLDYVFSHFLIGYNYLFGETGDMVKSNSGMEIYAGGNYRYHITEQFFVEGRLMAGWYNWEIETKYKSGKTTKTNKITTDKAFLGFAPQIGIDFGSWGINAGYRWDWVDFQFDKDHTADRFTIGLVFGL